MDLNLRYVSEQDIVWAEASGEITLRDGKRAAVDGLELAKQNHCNKYLIDISRAITKFTVIDVIVFIEGLISMGFTRRDRVAFVISRDEKDYEFWETAASNRGWSRIAYFVSSSEAAQWLTSR